MLCDNDQLVRRGIGEKDDGVFDGVCAISQSTARRAETCRSVLARRNSANPSFASSSPDAAWTTGATAPCTGYPSATTRLRPFRALFAAASSARSDAFSAMTF